MNAYQLFRTAAMLLALAFMAGCTTTRVVVHASQPAIQATEPVPASELMDIGIQPLNPGIPEDPEVQEARFIVPDVRKAESTWVAWHLKDTLELTGNWGAVRVTPDSSYAVDLEISGEIIHSDGERLEVQVKAVDATGKVWINDTYEDSASRYAYETPTEDPFQDLYNNIANDLLVVRKQLASERLANIKAVASLKYARDLAPDPFDAYLNERRGKFSVIQLPANNDSMMTRVSRIKEQEYLFVDTLDSYYSRFYREMQDSYNEWRNATYDEAIRLREVQRQARNNLIGGAIMVVGGLMAATEGSNTWATQAAAAGVASGGVRSIIGGVQRMKDAEIHARSLQEISESLGSEISPYVIEVEGKTTQLTGTADQQYVQWRALLKDIYAEETGLPQQ